MNDLNSFKQWLDHIAGIKSSLHGSPTLAKLDALVHSEYWGIVLDP